MTTFEDTSYPRALRRTDERRGRRDGEQRLPSLAEVRRRQQELGQGTQHVTVGYQLVLLAELDGRLSALFPAYQRIGQETARDIRQHRARVQDAARRHSRAEADVTAAKAALTSEELRPRNPQEERWSQEMLLSRREVARATRIKRAQRAADAARDQLHQRQVECAAAERRRDEALAEFGIQAQRLKELFQRRIATYVDALAQAHPEGRTLYPILSVPDLPLPDWVPTATLIEDSTPTGGTGDKN